MSKAYCLYCHKNMREEGGLVEMFYTDDVICEECRRKMRTHEKTISVGPIRIDGLYVYSGITREMMLQYKEYNDEAMYPIFLYKKIKTLKRKYKDYYLVTIPSSKESTEKRGFNHVKQLYSILELPFLDYFEKTADIQQKNQSLRDKRNIISYIKCRNTDLHDKNILVVDDIVTSGNSMLAAGKLLQGKCKSLKFLTICYNERYLSGAERLIKRLYDEN